MIVGEDCLAMRMGTTYELVHYILDFNCVLHTMLLKRFRFKNEKEDK